MLEGHATSEPGRVMCRQLMPETNIETIQKLIDETTAARERIRHKGKLSFAKVSDLNRIFDHLENGSALTAGDLLRKMTCLMQQVRRKIMAAAKLLKKKEIRLTADSTSFLH